MKIALVFTIVFLASTSAVSLTKEQRRRAEQFTSIFENDTIDFQYDYVEDIHDGRGYTCGRTGFTTATGDAYEVVKRYTKIKSNNPLAKYLPELKTLADKSSSDTKNLKGFVQAWKDSAKDKTFRDVQDKLVEQWAYQPAVRHANLVGVNTALSVCAIYDTVTEHGDGTDNHSVGAIIKRTNKNLSGTVKQGVDEKKWLREYIKVRKNDLIQQYKEKADLDRIDALNKLLDDGNMDLHAPIKIKTKQHDKTIP